MEHYIIIGNEKSESRFQILGNVRSGDLIATPSEASNLTEVSTKVLYEEVGDVRRAREEARPIKRSKFDMTSCEAYGFSSTDEEKMKKRVSQ